MAIGDLVGDLANAYLTPAQRAAQAAKNATGGGPIARVSDRLPTPSLASVAPVVSGQPAAAVANQQAAPNLANAMASTAPSVPAQVPASPASLAAAWPGGLTTQPTTQQDQRPASLADAAPGGRAAAPEQAAPQRTPSLADVAPGGRAIAVDSPASPPTLELAYRPTGVGTGANAIVARLGANGVPEFSNQPADLASAYGSTPIGSGAQMPTSLSQLMPASGADQSPSSTLASRGSLANLGDGIGTFSQAQSGDAALAMTRFQRANDLRNAYRAQDSADLARSRANQDASLGIVRDSSRTLTRSDVATNRMDQERQAQLVQNAANAQKSLEDLRAGQTAATQGRQAQRLEDAFAAATAPNATQADIAAYRRLNDPDGSKGLAQQLTTANIGKLQADARASDAKANSTSAGLDNQLKQLDIEKRQGDLAASSQERDTQKQSALTTAQDALKLVGEIGGDKRLNDITGPVYSRVPTTNGESQDLINKTQRLQTLLTADNLKLMTGVLTDRDITFLSQIGSGLGIGEKGINGSIEGTRQRLDEITTRLGEKIGNYQKAMQQPAGQPAGRQQPAQTSAPAVGSVQQGYVFLGGDPGNQANWRPQ